MFQTYICKKCGNIYGCFEDHKKCFICDTELQKLFDLDWDLIFQSSIEELDQYRLQFQPKEKYDMGAYSHREHMDISFKRSRNPEPRGFSRRYREGVVLAECPYCHCYYTKKISTCGRMLSVGLFGLGSKKIGKQWHCYLCDSDF